MSTPSKQRMKKRLIAACVYHGIIDGLELAVLGQQHSAYQKTHRELKYMLRSAPSLALRPVLNERLAVSDGAGGYLMVDQMPSIATLHRQIRKAKHVNTGLKAL